MAVGMRSSGVAARVGVLRVRWGWREWACCQMGWQANFGSFGGMVRVPPPRERVAMAVPQCQSARLVAWSSPLTLKGPPLASGSVGRI